LSPTFQIKILTDAQSIVVKLPLLGAQSLKNVSIQISVAHQAKRNATTVNALINVALKTFANMHPMIVLHTVCAVPPELFQELAHSEQMNHSMSSELKELTTAAHYLTICTMMVTTLQFMILLMVLSTTPQQDVATLHTETLPTPAVLKVQNGMPILKHVFHLAHVKDVVTSTAVMN
jgi:hypothetical protein